MTAQFQNADETLLVWTDAGGTEWSGIPCHLDGETVVVDSDTEMAKQAAEWIAAGNTPADYQAPATIVPEIVTPFQIKEVLRATELSPGVTLYDDATTWVASQTAQVQRAWEQVVEVKRGSTIVAALKARWSMTDAQVDALFEAAAAIEL